MTEPGLELPAAWRDQVLGILAAQCPELEVWCHGSRVQGRAREWSDLDLVLVSDQPINPAHLNALREAFACSNLPIRIDVADLRALPITLQQGVREAHVVLWNPRSGNPF
ncbi:MAG: nucleotidyltransferase domain-containing protein [Candidatus Delongbacteria bacterium]